MTDSISLDASARCSSGHAENVVQGLCQAVAEPGGIITSLRHTGRSRPDAPLRSDKLLNSHKSPGEEDSGETLDFRATEAAPLKRDRSSDRTFWKWVPSCCCRDHPAAILVMHAASVASSQRSPEPLTSKHLPLLNSEMGGWGLRPWRQSKCIPRARAGSTTEGKALGRSQSRSFLC